MQVAAGVQRAAAGEQPAAAAATSGSAAAAQAQAAATRAAAQALPLPLGGSALGSPVYKWRLRLEMFGVLASGAMQVRGAAAGAGLGGAARCLCGGTPCRHSAPLCRPHAPHAPHTCS